MKRFILIVFLLGLSLPGRVFAQAMFAGTAARAAASASEALPAYPLALGAPLPAPRLDTPDELPVMSPELTLSTYQHRIALQAAELASYSTVTVVRAELPDTSQQGEFELQRKFEAPHSLQFTPVRYTGDGFVKNNVITRILQTEVDHVQKDDPALSAISPAN